MRNEIDGKTAVYGLIGNPVAHSFSPLIHNTLANGLGENLLYTTFPVKDAEQLETAVKGAGALGIQGMNVTVPYKSAVIPFLLETEPGAEAIGAVNTLVAIKNEDGIVRGYRGYNTDYMGLKRALEEMKICLSDMSVILIGAGGAARAAAFMCGAAGVKNLSFLNRTAQKAENLARELHLSFPEMEIGVHGLSEAAKEAERLERVLAIQCTSVGLAPNTEALPIDDPAFYANIEAAYDCIYNPEETKFLQMVHAAGKLGRSGMDMLLWQGILAFQFWTGKMPERTLIEEIRRKLYAFIRKG